MPSLRGILQFLLHVVEQQLRITIKALAQLKAQIRQFIHGDQRAHDNADTLWTGPSTDLVSQLIPLYNARKKHRTKRRLLRRLARAIRSTLRFDHITQSTVEHYIGRMERINSPPFALSSS